jgi:ethanolamine transporter EutH
MKKIILTYGIISGVIVSVMLLATQPLFRNGTLDMDTGMYVGFSTMIVALSLIFFGIKSFRDQHLQGSISFGRAFTVGILIALVASVIYALSWEVYIHTVGQDFMEWYQQCRMEKLVKEGASDQELTESRAEMQSMAELYKNPIIRFGMTLTEIFPVGLIITLVSAGVLKRKDVLPAK